MAVFNCWQGRGKLSMMHALIIKLVVLLGWLCNFGLAQFELSETVTGSASFNDLGITCIGNVAVFITTILRGRLDREMGARDVLAILRGPKLEHIHRIGVTTSKNREYQDVSVVMLSTQQPNSSICQFMKYISYAYDLQSIMMQYIPLQSAQVSVEICNCSVNCVNCRCIVFWTVEEITIMLARRLPGTLKRLSDSLCLLPSLDCLRNGCHGCNHGLLHVEETHGGQRLREGDSMVESPAAVCDVISGRSSDQEEHICICIPVHPACDDEWTKMLIRSFRCKDKAGRGVRIITSDALENYMGKSGTCSALEKYSRATLLVPRLAEVYINLKLTFYFGVDGFSSSLVARRALRNYLVDSRGTGFVANAFVTKALVKSNADNTNVCQVLTFTSSFLSLRNLSFMIGCSNLISSIGWGLLVAFEGDGKKWYEIHSMPPSKLRVVVIMTAICIALGMDCLHLHLSKFHLSRRVPPMLWAVMILEIMCIVWGSANMLLEIMCIVWGSPLAGVVGIYVYEKWIYSALQGLVWVKWGIGSYLLSEYSPEFDYKVSGSPLLVNHYPSKWTNGILVYSSAFLLNAILAGVRGEWDYSQSS